MFIARAERIDLLQLGVRRWDTQQVDVVPVPASDGCVLVWRDHPGYLPDALIVADGATQSFFAWTGTYAPHLTPISALTDVAEYRDSDALFRGSARSLRGTEDRAQMRGYLGLVHAEVAAAFRGGSPPRATGLTPFVSTFSWIALQQQSNGHATALTTLRERWDEARRLLDAHRLGYDSSDVEEVWNLVTSSESKQPKHARDVRAFLDSVSAGTPGFDTLPAAEKHADDLHAVQSGPLEARIETFKRLSQELYESRSPAASSAVVLGFALSCISQGSFAHAGLLGPSRISDARPLLWYGWFDFLRHEPTAASPSASAAILQLLRTIGGGELAHCRAQISIDELRIISRDQDPFSQCLLDIRHPVRVALAPHTICAIQAGLRSDVRGRQRSLFEDRT